MIIDLCCGKGRFESSLDDVISIDISKETKPTILADVRFLPLRENLQPRLCHASPPCVYFSRIRACRGEGIVPLGVAEGLEIVAACFRAFDWLKPKMWTLENPDGLLNRIMPTKIETEYSQYDMPKKKTVFWSNNSKALKRALIPMDIRKKILEVAEKCAAT